MGLISALDRGLSRIYVACGVAAALCLIALALLVLTSIVSRLLSLYVPGVIEYSGYAMAASSFFALAHAFRSGSHIRVNLLLNRLRGTAQRLAEIWCLGIASFVGTYLAFYLARLCYVSWQLEERSEGADAILLWVPQTLVAIGSTVFAICLVHNLIRVIARADKRAPVAEGVQ